MRLRCLRLDPGSPGLGLGDSSQQVLRPLGAFAVPPVTHAPLKCSINGGRPAAPAGTQRPSWAHRGGPCHPLQEAFPRIQVELRASSLSAPPRPARRQHTGGSRPAPTERSRQAQSQPGLQPWARGPPGRLALRNHRPDLARDPGRQNPKISHEQRELLRLGLPAWASEKGIELRRCRGRERLEHDGETCRRNRGAIGPAGSRREGPRAPAPPRASRHGTPAGAQQGCSVTISWDCETQRPKNEHASSRLA